jgi:hypothetical protein
VIIWAEIGDARRFSSSDRLVRFAGLDVTVRWQMLTGASVAAGLTRAALGRRIRSRSVTDREPRSVVLGLLDLVDEGSSLLLPKNIQRSRAAVVATT